jgi:flavin reductase (DIM6/NTAB) family NADH-FMN oxidoreductase RutF
MEEFKSIKPEDIRENVFKLIGTDWMLITSGTIDSFNTMTASWGGLGVLWHKNVCYIFVRPQRYTYEFLQEHMNFTLCFFSDKYKNVLNFCGTKSGREVNKIEKTGISPRETESGSVYFDEARLVIECRKIYYQDIDHRNFLDARIDENYPGGDYHRMYIGEIISAMEK